MDRSSAMLDLLLILLSILGLMLFWGWEVYVW